MTFTEQLSAAWQRNDSLLCVGLDPDPAKLLDAYDGWTPTAEATDCIYGLGDLTDYEKDSLDKMMPELQASIDKGVDFVKNM